MSKHWYLLQSTRKNPVCFPGLRTLEVFRPLFLNGVGCLLINFFFLSYSHRNAFVYVLAMYPLQLNRFGLPEYLKLLFWSQAGGPFRATVSK